MGYLQIIRAVRARRGIVISVALLCLGLAMSTSVHQEKSYRATASVVLQYRSGAQVHDGSLLKQTQVELIRSQALALNVVDVLGLTSSPSFQHAYNDAVNGNESMRSWLAAGLRQSLKIQPLRDSNIVDINFNAADPVYAARVANAFALVCSQAGDGLPRTHFTDAAILNIAAVPIEPIGPKLWQVALSSLLFGGLAGAMMAVFAEISDRHIRSSQDLADAAEVPVLSVLMVARPQSARPSAQGLTRLWRLSGLISWRT